MAAKTYMAIGFVAAAAIGVLILSQDGIPTLVRNEEIPAKSAHVDVPNASAKLEAGAANIKEEMTPAANGGGTDPKRSERSDLRLNILTLDRSIEDALRSASSSGRPDEAYAAVQIGIVCGTMETIKDEDVAKIAGVVVPSADDVGRIAASKQMTAARQKLLAYCGTFRGAEQSSMMEKAKSTVKSATSITKVAFQIPRKNEAGGLPTLTQEQSQAAITAFSQPSVYPLVLDRLLSGGAIGLPAYRALSVDQRNVAQSLVYWELSGDRSPASLRNVFTCSMTAVCLQADGGSSVIATAETVAVASQIVAMARNQDWSGLGFNR